MNTTKTGREAEAAAADFLKQQGFKIIEQNWRTRFCEIDVIAEKAKTLYFVEVKYRASDRQGSGLEYITPAKLKQMQFAAEAWVAEHDWLADYCLSGLEVYGADFRIGEFIESIS